MNIPRFLPKPRHWTPAPGLLDTRELDSPEALRRHALPAHFRSSEAYRITLSDTRKTIEIGGQPALRHAWNHLRQWQGDHPERTPCGTLEDAPALSRRAFMLDISRCKVPTRDSLRHWVRLLAAFRFNELQLYTEHTFAYSQHQTVWRHASPITPDDLLFLHQLCADHGIDLVPNQNTFGHFERWLRHPQYRTYAECPDGFLTPWGEPRPEGSVLKPDPASLRLVHQLLDELLPHFPSDRANIGCDETWELGQGASRQQCQQRGTGAVYASFLRDIMRHVLDHHHKRPMFWGDILLKHPRHLHLLPQEAIALEWGYEADHPFESETRTFADSGLSFYLCPGTSSWNSFAGRAQNMITNIRNAAQCAQSHRAEGLLLTDWGDNGHLQQEPVSWPALAWAGLNAWNPDLATESDAWDWCDLHAFREPGATQRWLDLGRVADTLEWNPNNANAPFAFWLNRPVWNPHFHRVSDAAIQNALRHLESLQPPSSQQDPWQHTRNLLALGLHTEAARRGLAPFPHHLHQTCATEHARLWRLLNREGGLAESLSYFSSQPQPLECT